MSRVYYKCYDCKEPVPEGRKAPRCRTCNTEYMRGWREANADKHREYDRQRHIANRDEKNARREQHRKNNLGMDAQKSARRRLRVKQQTPAWNDDLVMRMIYEDCPKGHHVDHIVPLNGKNVSGLHVHYNLQWLTAEENMRKSNMLDEWT